MSAELPRPPVRRHVRGFTLIELLVVVAILGILVSIAVPSYRLQMIKAHRAEAINALMDVASRQERFYNDNRTYTTDMAALGFAADPLITAGGYYSVDAVAGDSGIGTSYVATATRRAGQTADGICGNFKINSEGRTWIASGSASAEDCW
ncbi:MAG: type IV pilin protein [Thiohalocapsa sp.]|nr:type IV pilin protein [Thiohalocapsa sp.]